MPARNTPFLDDRVRQKIQCGMLISRLQKFVAGEIKMSPAQVTAALGLLRKRVPDLSQVEMSGETTMRHVIGEQPLTEQEFIEKHGVDTGVRRH
jgi:hypothetical protein